MDISIHKRCRWTVERTRSIHTTYSSYAARLETTMLLCSTVFSVLIIQAQAL